MPIDFNLLQRSNPAQAMSQGYQMGAPIGQMRQQQAQQAQAQQLAKQKEAEKAEAVRVETERAAELKQYMKIFMDDPTSKNGLDVLSRLPQKQQAEMGKAMVGVQEEVKHNLLTTQLKMVSAISGSDPTEVVPLLEQFVAGLDPSNEKDQVAINAYNHYIKKMTPVKEGEPVDPLKLKEVRGSLILQTLASDEGIASLEAWEDQKKGDREEDKNIRDETILDLDVAKFAQTLNWAEMGADTITKKAIEAGFNEEAANIIGAFAGDLQGYDALDFEAKVALEDKYRTQLLDLNKAGRASYIKREKVRSASAAATKLYNEGKTGQGPHDLVMVNIFQRFMDDGMVRSEDVKLQRASGGAVDEIVTAVTGWTTGAILSPNVRKQMVAATDYLMDAEIKMMDKNNALYEKVITGNGLRRELIFDDEYLARQESQDEEIEADFNDDADETGFNNDAYKEFLIKRFGKAERDSITNSSIAYLKEHNPGSTQAYIDTLGDKGSSSSGTVKVGY